MTEVVGREIGASGGRRLGGVDGVDRQGAKQNRGAEV